MHRDFNSKLAVVLGSLSLFGGVFRYVRDAVLASELLLIVAGAILITVGALTMAVRQILRDELNRREQEGKPVPNI
ncbi:MAG: hypothetical protein WBQ43_14845 [Terriglobales bacterium]